MEIGDDIITNLAFVDYYIENSEWCILNSEPDINTVAEKLNDIEYQKQGLFVSRNFDNFLNTFDASVLINCIGSVLFDESKMQKIFVCGNSDVDLIVNNNIVDIYVFHKSKISISVSGNGKARIHKYNKTKIKTTEKEINSKSIKIINNL